MDSKKLFFLLLIATCLLLQLTESKALPKPKNYHLRPKRQFGGSQATAIANANAFSNGGGFGYPYGGFGGAGSTAIANANANANSFGGGFFGGR